MKTKTLWLNNKNIIFLVSIIVMGIILPMITSSYSIMVLNIALISFLVTLSISVMLGIGGHLTFAGVSFMGIGAYITANLTTGRILDIQCNTIPAMFISVIITGVIAFLLGLVLFRLKGTYFTFATIGLVQVTSSVYMSYTPLFGGPDGISGIPVISIFRWTPSDYYDWFYVLFIIAIIAGLVIERVRKTQLGRSLACIRDNEIAAYTLGIDVHKTKVIGFSIAAMLCALGGSLYAMHNQFISSDAFTFDMSTQYVIMAMLGGINSTTGSFIGSLLITMLPEWLRPVQQYLKLSYGIGIIIIMIFMPEGIYGLLRNTFNKIRNKKDSKEVTVDESNTSS